MHLVDDHASAMHLHERRQRCKLLVGKAAAKRVMRVTENHGCRARAQRGVDAIKIKGKTVLVAAHGYFDDLPSCHAYGFKEGWICRRHHHHATGRGRKYVDRKLDSAQYVWQDAHLSWLNHKAKTSGQPCRAGLWQAGILWLRRVAGAAVLDGIVERIPDDPSTGKSISATQAGSTSSP